MISHNNSYVFALDHISGLTPICTSCLKMVLYRKEIDMIVFDIIAVADIFVVLGLAAKLILWLFLLFSLQLFDVVYSYGSFSCC